MAARTQSGAADHLNRRAPEREDTIANILIEQPSCLMIVSVCAQYRLTVATGRGVLVQMRLGHRRDSLVLADIVIG